MTHFKNHSIEVQDSADVSAVIIGSLTQVDAPIDNEVLKDETGGKAYLDELSVVSQKSRMTFNTFDLPKVITAFGMPGRLLTEDTGKVGLALYQAKYTNGGTVVAGANHRRLRFALSHARSNRISVSHRSNAQIECEAVALWDGTNDPVLLEESNSLPTLPATPGRWALSSMTVGGVAISCKTQVDIDFGFNVDAYGCDDEIWDTHLDVTQIAPMVTITSLDVENFDSTKVVLEGLVGTQANSSIVLRKRTESQATYEADNGSEHIKITFAGVILPTSLHSASGNGKAQSTYRIEVAYDGTNAPFVFDTAYDIV